MWDAGRARDVFSEAFNRTRISCGRRKSRIDCREPPELCGAPNAMPQWLRQGGYFVRSKSNLL